MKRILLFNIAGLFLLIGSHLAAQCKVKPIIKSCMQSLSPYQYDSYAVKEITYGPTIKKEILEFSVYSEENYKLVFGKTLLPQVINITIYDKHPSTKDKKIIYFDDSGKKDKFVCDFKPKTTGTYYIEFEVPAASAPNQKGCFVVLIGVKD